MINPFQWNAADGMVLRNTVRKIGVLLNSRKHIVIPQVLWYTMFVSIIFKNQGAKRYAYLSSLEGKTIRQRYIGNAEDPAVKKLLEVKADAAAVPERLAYLFWDTSLRNIRVKQHARSVITRILELGDMDAVQWMQTAYPGAKIIEVLLTARNLSEKSRNFWKIWYEVNDNA